MKNIILSIVIPSYNKEIQLPRLLDSVIHSSSFDESIEVIISDDYSTDNTEEVIQKYLLEYTNIIYLKADQNGGVHTARNIGIEKAKGEYVAFVDGDDYLNNEGLNIILESVKNYNKYDIIFFSYITSDTKEKSGYRRIGEIHLDELYYKHDIFRSIKGCVGIVRNALIEENNIQWYYTNLDSLFWRECEYHAKDQLIYAIDNPIGIYDRDIIGSLSDQRSEINHIKKLADMKIEKTILFLNRMEKYFTNHKDIACSYIDGLRTDYNFSKNKKVNFNLIQKEALKYNFSKLKLFKIRFIPNIYIRTRMKLKKAYLDRKKRKI